ncbi:hypothetical protein Murru_2055 [Allomuricauda ruestringensis DSM 13258]|uniref:DUF3667 domain-containing protein n=1 Tax=Allomuricauda ruestringensis (strain DSM 13258 / CIP 107369 / LMG 19739 / B1) TaxID=886377 RepID=G2PL65_ALLRU|nr:DUF3667 domain-containing protein [Allomuricauda ruestringensis]AEM71094.1 hypothetical protein Murru_2055 [Allomuricauda ruestringensis DSM 13258]
MGKKDGLITKGRYELKFRGVKCLNCGHSLDISDKYCPNCSQANSTKKLTLKDFIDEFFSGLINYDSKLIKSLSALLLRPGRITKDYVNGKRITYTNPFRFLLSLAFLYFLMFTYNNQFSSWDRDVSKFNGDIGGTPLVFNTDSGNLGVDSTKLERQKTQALAQLDSLAGEDPETRNQLKQLDTLSGLGTLINNEITKRDSIMLSNPKAYFNGLKSKSNLNAFFKKIDFFTKTIKRDTLTSYDQAALKYDIENTWSNKMAFNSANSILRAIKEPGSWVNSTISKLPFVIFFFMPVFTVFIWLVYIRKNYTYTDHLIFSFHNQSLLFILLILSLTLDTIFNINSSGIFLLIFAFYLYKAMRKFYGQGRFKTIVKYIFLNTVFMILAFFTIIVTFAGSGLTY